MKKKNLFYFSSLSVSMVLLTAVLGFPSWAHADSEDIWTSFMKHGDIDKAIAAFEQAIKDDPDDSLAHAGLAVLAPSRSRETHDTTQHWLQALSTGIAQPEASLYLFELLNSLTTHDDYTKGLSGIEKLLKHDDISDHLRSLLQYSRAMLLKRLGKWQEAAASFEAFGIVTHFWYCGPFDNAEEGGHERAYGPEKNLDFNATYQGRRKTVGWRPVPIEPYDGYINLHAFIDPSNESTTYLVAVLNSTTPQKCAIHIGHGGALKVWLNGDLLANADRYHNVMPDQVNVEGHLEAGTNTLLLKVSSGEKGKYGVLVRVVAENQEALSIPSPHTLKQLPQIAPHVPKEESEAPRIVNFDPVSLLQLKAIGEAEGLYPRRQLFYAMLLQDWHVADENDVSANTVLAQMTTVFPNNPLLWKMQGDSEKQDNRKRLAYKKALELDPSDQSSFIHLLRYYRRSPYATLGLDLIRDWEKKNEELPASAQIERARILSGKGFREAAYDIVHSLNEDLGAKERLFQYNLHAGHMSEIQKRAELEAILRDYPQELQAIHSLRTILLRQEDTEELQAILEQERKIDPFSIAGWMDIVHNQQAKGDFEESLQTIRNILVLSPDHYEAHRLSAIAYHQLDQDDNAVRELQQALATRPSDPWCLEYLEFLQPDQETYASPYRVDWKTIQVPDDLDLSKANHLVLLHQRIVKVHANGNASETVREAVKILTETGIRYHQVRGIYYEGDNEEVRILRARIWKPDGSFIDAPAPTYRSTSSASDASRRLYGDYNVAILRFEGLEKDAVLELEYEKEQRGENIYADYFGDLFYVGDNYFEPTVQTDYVLITPQSREFYWKYTPPHYPQSVSAPELASDPQPVETKEDSNRIWKWSFRNLPTVPREPLMPAQSEILPYIKVSTFKTWSDMTHWYWNLARDQLIPGTIIQQRLAKILTDYKKKLGLPPSAQLNDWEKVRAVNAFVNTGVRYLGLEFGIHGYKPHKVDDICNAQYGDCKDKASLAVAMMKELGIEANLVILRTTDMGEIDYELPSLGIFNHAIYYLPNIDGKEYWIDGTATFFDASELPPGDAGSNTLIVKPGGDYEFKRIPYSKPENNGALFTTSLTLDKTGTATGYRVAEFRGLYNPVVRSTYENSSKAKEIVDRILTGTYPGAQSSNIELSDLQDYATSERLAYNMVIPQFGVRQRGRWVLPSTLFKEMMSQRYATLSQREYDLVLTYPWTRTNIFTITFPTPPKSPELPENRDMNNKYGRYSRTFKLEGNTLTIHEELVFKPVRVPKEEYADFREFCRLVDHYQDEKILFEEG